MALQLPSFLQSLTTKASLGPKRVVGIDFGSASVKVVELTQKQESVAVTSYGELQLGPYDETDLGQVVDLEDGKKIQALVDVIRESNIKAKDGILALPLAASFVTVISFSADPKEDIASRVRVEARKYIPVPIADVVLDWSEIKPVGETKTNIREILVAAIQNDSLASLNEVMRSVSMVSQPSEIEIFSALRSVNHNPKETIALLDLGAKTSKLYLSSEGALHRLHRTPIGGVHASKKVAEVLEVPFIEAENYKRNYDPTDSKAADIKKAVITNYERPMQEFRRMLEQYEQRRGVPVDRVVLCGGAAMFSEIIPFTQYVFDRPVEKANPFSQVSYPAFMEDTLTEIGPSFSVALGVALRPFQA